MLPISACATAPAPPQPARPRPRRKGHARGGSAIVRRFRGEGFEVRELDVLNGFDVSNPQAWEHVGSVEVACLNAGVVTGNGEVASLTAIEALRDASEGGVAATVERLSHAVAALDPFRLAGLSPLVTVGGSLVAALAVLEKAMTAEQAWAVVSIDDRWQLEQWGADAEAEAALDDRRRDFFAAATFLELLS